MKYFNSKNNKKNQLWAIIILFVCSIFLVWKDIIESWHLIHSVIIAILLILGYFIYKWIEKKKKEKPVSLWKDFQKKYPIIIQYAPPKWINPAEAWLLYNLKVEPTDLTSMIYQWKFEWLIDIKIFAWENSNKEYIKLIKKNDIPLTRPLFETEIFDSIFTMWNVKIIEWAFQLRYALMLEDLEYHWIKKGWVDKISLWKWWEYLYYFLITLLFTCSYIIMTWGFMRFNHFFRFFFLVLLFSCIFLWWYIYWWGNLKFTDKWAAIASRLIGYRNFIKSCDENKIKLLLKEDPLFIDRTLPYATAFGLETEFLNKISPLKKDRNAKYFRWKKVSPRIWVLHMLISNSDDNSLL